MNGKLHHYTADTTDRTRVHIILFIVATLSAWLLGKFFDYYEIQPPWWLEVPSMFGFYVIYFGLFNQYLWKVKLIRFLLRIETPVIGGTYETELRSSFDDFSSVKKITYEILQKWNTILIFSETDTSYSKSLSASFHLCDVNRQSIVFQYQNSPKASAPSHLNIHYGFAEFCIISETKITGEYFTGRSRNTWGTIELKKIK